MNEDQEIKIGLTCSDDANNSGIPNSSEWSNGDACLYDGSDYIFVGMTPTFNDVSCIIFSAINGIEHVSVNKLRKQETQEQREERDRLEAAKELACVYWGVKTDADPSPELLKSMLRIVDKTNYRLTK